MSAPTKIDVRQELWRSVATMIGSAANITADNLFSTIDSITQKLVEDRNIILSDGGVISLSSNGQTLSFTQNINLVINQTASGGTPTSISLGSSSVTFTSSGYLWYATVNRTAPSASTSTVAPGTGLPTATNANQDIFLLGVRIDSADGTKTVYLRGGTIVMAGQSARLGSTSVLDNYFSIGNSSDSTKKIAFSASGSSTATTLTLSTAQTTSQTLAIPNVGASDTVVTNKTTASIINKQVSYSSSNDATSGTAITLTSFTTGIVRLTSGSLVSISGIPAGNSGQTLVVENNTGNTVTINNDDAGATAANRIFTGSGIAVSIFNHASFVFTYDSTNSRWMLTGSTPIQGGLSTKVVFSTPGSTNWTVPAGVTTILIVGVGGGGGGGGGDGSSKGGGGGAGAGYNVVTQTVTPLAVIPIVVGAAGAGGAVNNNGTTGGSTSFNGSTVSRGGDGGHTGGTDSLGGVAYAGAASGGDGGTTGNGINGVGSVTSGGGQAHRGGGGGSSFYGQGGSGGILSGASATNGDVGAGGGGGGVNAGGDGGAGRLEIIY